MAEIRVSGLGVTFEDGTQALDGVGLDVADGELLVLVGPSGCGKSTLLRCVAGLQEPSEGRIEIDGKDVTWASPRDRDVAMVFQSYALYPHLTVRDNLAFGLRLRGVSKAERRVRAEEVARTLGIEETLDRRPRALSGGQRQRVAMGRAIVRDPGAFLMDEPLSNLDAKLRSEMRSQITLLQKGLRATMLYVTHDQVEAMTMGDRVAVMRDGKIVQLAAPAELYQRPASTYVAGFIGSPPMNLAPARVLDDARLEVGRSSVLAAPPVALEGRRLVTVGIRPEHFRLPQDGDQRIRVAPVLVEELGFAVDVLFEPCPGVTFTARLPTGTKASAGTPVELGVPRGCLRVFDDKTGEAIG